MRVGRAIGPVGEADDWARANAVECLYLLVDTADGRRSRAAEEAGFLLVDVRMELTRATAAEHSSVREHRPDEVDLLRAIARASHKDTRFYADPRFPRERCDELYDTWIRRSSEGWARTVLVPDGPEPAAGYVTVHVDGTPERGSIGLIAVGEASRGQGLGATLVRGAVAWCHARGVGEISVVTQGRNVAAQRLLQQCGFRTSSVGLWFHKWYRPGGDGAQGAAAT